MPSAVSRLTASSTAFAVNGSPFENFTPSCSLKRQVVSFVRSQLFASRRDDLLRLVVPPHQAVVDARRVERVDRAARPVLRIERRRLRLDGQDDRAGRARQRCWRRAWRPRRASRPPPASAPRPAWRWPAAAGALVAAAAGGCAAGAEVAGASFAAGAGGAAGAHAPNTRSATTDSTVSRTTPRCILRVIIDLPAAPSVEPPVARTLGVTVMQGLLARCPLLCDQLLLSVEIPRLLSTRPARRSKYRRHFLDARVMFAVHTRSGKGVACPPDCSGRQYGALCRSRPEPAPSAEARLSTHGRGSSRPLFAGACPHGDAPRPSLVPVGGAVIAQYLPADVGRPAPCFPYPRR